MEDERQTLVGPADSNVETTAVWQEHVIWSHPSILPARGLSSGLGSRQGLSSAQKTHTSSPIGAMLSAQIQLMASLLTRTHPCETGNGGTYESPWIAIPL